MSISINWSSLRVYPILHHCKIYKSDVLWLYSKQLNINPHSKQIIKLYIASILFEIFLRNMWLKSNLFVILVILLVINLFDESYAKGGMAKNSGKRKFFFLVKDGPRPNMITIFLSTFSLPIVLFLKQVEQKILCELLKKFGHCFRFTTNKHPKKE